jgi:hypothetical protein
MEFGTLDELPKMDGIQLRRVNRMLQESEGNDKVFSCAKGAQACGCYFGLFFHASNFY